MDKQEPLPEWYLRLKEGTLFMKIVWRDYYRTTNAYSHPNPGHLPATTFADGKIVTTVGLRHER